jgi:hypothetical protein
MVFDARGDGIDGEGVTRLVHCHRNPPFGAAADYVRENSETVRDPMPDARPSANRRSAICGLVILARPPVSFPAKPVTNADLSGKTFCTSSGDKETYLRGGKYVGKDWGDGAWQLMSDGVVSVHARSADWVASIEKLTDGSFEFRVAGQSFIHTGHYCK